MADKTGHCMCGAVSFRAVDMADEFSACHCKMCQRWTGSFFKGVSVATENLAITGRENIRSEEHTSELQSRRNLVCRLLLEKKKNN